MDIETLLIHHGARDSVTGSCHELKLPGGDGLLIDCGQFQGQDANTPQEIDFPTDHLCGIVITHVHIDHCGRLPYLLATGFDKPIYCSEASAKLLPTVLRDAVKLSITRDKRLIEQFVDRIESLLQPLPYNHWQPINTGTDDYLEIRLQPAGHILGSAYVECRFQNPGRKAPYKVIFSGDLGAPYAPILPSPKSPYSAELLILESTYGDRNHDGRKERVNKLQAMIEKALENRGVILIPAFSIGRTQELLYEIEELIYRNRRRFAARNLPWEELEIILDSPLASQFTKLYRELQPYWDAEAKQKLRRGRKPLAFEQITTIDHHRDHLHTVDYLKRKARPCIVIAASGMCTGGRIVNYLQALLGDPRTDVLFSGYQAAGTPGRTIQTYGPQGGYVMLDGKKVDIKARIHTLSGYSAHADQKDLVNFIKNMRKRPQHVRLVHGEPDAKIALQHKLEQLGITVD
ncbi:MAG: MBL fold metallo-hydrolase [Desulfuromonadales bacterium]|nr:MBL fold metallo-hydrolase [Desulfuromonadales bacterium]